jgi:Helitron helicase-like domain at N-terminus
LNNSLIVVEYFHNMITVIIENILKEGIFGGINHYYEIIEYQGRGTPHMHLAIYHIYSTSRETHRRKRKHQSQLPEPQ